jgi:hypothetical protein
MRSVGTIDITWRNGEDAFCLAKVGDLLALEEKCNAGIATIMNRLETGQWFVNDIRETIRLGLIGGGMKPDKAMTVVKLHVDGNPKGLAESIVIARLILMAVVVGVPGEELGKAEAAEATTADQVSTETTVASAAPPSSELEQLLDGQFETRTTPVSGRSQPPSRDMPEQTILTQALNL